MNLVHNIDPVADLRGRIDGIVPQVPHVVHAVVGGGVDLQHVHTGAAVNAETGGAAVAGVAVLGVQAVDRLGHDLGTACLAGAPGAGEEVGMAQASGLELGFEDPGDPLLAHHLVKGLGPVFPIKSLIHDSTSGTTTINKSTGP